MMFDKLEERAMRLAGKGYFGVAIASVIYILLRARWDIKLAAILAIVCFFIYCYLDPVDEDDRDS